MIENFLHVIVSLQSSLAAQAPAPAVDGPGFATQFFPIILIIVVFWFLVISPQRKEMKEKDTMRSALKKGDDVVTSGGLHGRIEHVAKETVTLEISPKVKVVYEKSAILRRTAAAPPEESK